MVEFVTQLGYRRRPTRVVAVGEVGVGGAEPIRIQSMLTCATWDVEAAIAETRGLVEAGCEIVRVTVPTRKDAEALPLLRRRMQKERLRAPLVADIHFNPRLALAVVPHVEKVRINPGNYVDQKRFAVREYSDAEYAAELARIEEALLPLIRALKAHGRSLRIGVNHGSLADRIFNRYGDTAEGMVEAALEYLRVLAHHGYHETILSMKSSNPLVAVQAYRLLALRMAAEGMDYPLHLGVTEAGDGLDGRVKSAIGIGSLLCDGLGDTIRVSLTEPAAAEIPAARALLRAVEALRRGPNWPEAGYRAPVAYRRRASLATSLVGVAVGGEAPAAFLALHCKAHGPPPPGAAQAFDGVVVVPVEAWPPAPLSLVADSESGTPVVLVAGEELAAQGEAALVRLLEGADRWPQSALVLVKGPHYLYPIRRLAALLDARGLRWPIGAIVPLGALAKGLGCERALAAAAEIGSLAVDGLLDTLVCPIAEPASPETEFSRVLLQAARLRTYKTDYISCPSCGRTLFDLQETTERIKARTRHLKGLKIAIMGCIVNGPGEMADADFGYVGGAPGKVNLYQGKDCLARGIPTDQAVERLVELIKQSGRWVEA
ncbi:MAG: (E)-4-hydroxy-3-methylbut-2-enyl-diphosphate synthase [Candidatus Lambdaproteobacteria bacterium]|nr:(E)-4-hydroxy-3-methylbut-2-enyl-diphosphate synthase [Candidatus Lambdaproteobacteria bacterium]